MRNRFADAIYSIGREDKRIVMLVADISPAGAMEKFQAEFPERFLNVGVAEQSMIGIAAGLALRGKRPFCYTIATFSLYRPFEMIRVDLCYQDLPVTVVGMGAGTVYSTLGGTHHTVEDIAVAAAIPNMQVLAPCDPDEMAQAARWCALESRHPVYLRLGKAGEPNLTAHALEPFEFGRVRRLRQGSRVAILSYGTMVERALIVADRIEQATGVPATVACVHTIKPLDEEGIARILRSHDVVAVLEEHVPHGGLGSRVTELAWNERAGCRLVKFSLKDEFIHYYGSHAGLLAAHGLDVDRITNTLLLPA